MRVRLLVMLILAPGCFGKSRGGPVTGGLTTGAITAPIHEELRDPAQLSTGTEEPALNGVELRGFMAAGIDDPAIPNAYGFAVRQLGDGIQSSVQAGWAITGQLGSAMVFGRLMFDLLSWTKLHDETTLSAFSPTADMGIAPFGHGLCVSASTTWDVRFNEPDRMIVGAFVGLCGGAMK
jgi:hypothetical protein